MHPTPKLKLKELKKKVTLLRHFKNYMMTDVLERKDRQHVQ